MFGFFKKANRTEQKADATPQATQDADAQEGVQPFTASALGQARYEVEHNQFRDFFFQNPTGFIDALMAEFGLCELHFEALKHYKMKTRYGAEPYQVATGKTDRGDFILRGKLPTPEYTGLVYRFYLAFDASFTHLGYYLVERTEDGGVVCAIDADGNREDVRQLEAVEWSEYSKEQKAAEIDLITRLYYGEDPDAEPETPAEEGEPETPAEEGEPEAPAEEGEPEAPAEEGEPEALVDAEAVDSSLEDGEAEKA